MYSHYFAAISSLILSLSVVAAEPVTAALEPRVTSADCLTVKEYATCRSTQLGTTNCITSSKITDQLSCTCSVQSRYFECYKTYCTAASDTQYAFFTSTLAQCSRMVQGTAGAGDPFVPTATDSVPVATGPATGNSPTNKPNAAGRTLVAWGELVVVALVASLWAAGGAWMMLAV